MCVRVYLEVRSAQQEEQLFLIALERTILKLFCQLRIRMRKTLLEIFLSVFSLHTFTCDT